MASTSAASPSTLAAPIELLPRSQLTDNQKWKFVFDNALQSGAVGLLIGGGASFLLAKSTAFRVGAALFGCGFGCGKAYVDARYVFNHDGPASRHWIVSVTKTPVVGSNAATGGDK
jgi:inner membrane organizing system protein 1